MKFFKASFDVIILRYYLMMTVVVLSYVLGIELLAILALPLFLSAIMGIKFESRSMVTSAKAVTRNMIIPSKDYQKAS